MANKIAQQFDVSSCTTIEGVLEETGTNWEPRLYTPSYSLVEHEAARVVLDESSKAIVNPFNSKVLGYVGERYKPNSHRGQLMALDTLVRDGKLTPSNVSVWDHGSVLAFQFRAEGLDMVIQGRDIVSPLLTLAFWHDGLGSDKGFFADFRWFCKNQMGQVGRLTADGSNVRHMGQNLTKYQELVLGRIQELGSGLSERYNTMRRMIDVPMTPTSTLLYLAKVAGAEDPVTTCSNVEILEPSKLRGVDGTVKDMLYSVWKDDCGAPGSLWQAFNGVTRFLTHDQGRSEAGRSARALLGSGGGLASKAFVVASTIVGA